MLVDTHVHVVAADRARYPLSPLGGRAGDWVREMPVTAEQLLVLMDGAGVDRAVLVQAASAYGFSNDYTADSARRYPNRFVGVCIIDVLAPAAADRLSYWVEEQGMRGMRLFTSPRPEAPELDGPATLAVWRRAAELKVPFIVQMRSSHLPRLKPMLERFPERPVALDHLAGSSSLGEGPLQESLPALTALAELPNLHLKFSTDNLDVLARAGATIEDFFQELLDRFGPRRLLWGSNFSATYDRPYGEMVELARRAFAFLTPEDRELVLGEAALGLWPSLGGDR